MSDIGVAKEQLKSIIERIERLEEEKKAISDDIKDVFGEAKANGFDTKVLRQVVRLRKQDMAEREEQETIRDLYLHALGMLPDTNGDEAEPSA
ncbi:MAG: DUF2312 domain-containing protein [Nitratireductor sp.]